MKFETTFLIALKSLLGNRMRTILTTGGVVVGIGAIVFLVSLGYGVQELIIDKITGLDALRIIDVTTVKSKIIKLDEENLTKITHLDNVESAETLVNLPGKINFGGSTTDVVVFAANNEYLSMASIKTSFGEIFDKEKNNEVIVNKAVLRLVGFDENKYNEALGQEADMDFWVLPELVTEETEESINFQKKLQIRGVIDDNETPYVFVPLELMTEQGVTNFSQAKIKVNNKANLETVRQQIEAMGFSTASAADTVEQIDQIFSLFRIVLAAFGSIALIVASIGMFNTLTVSLLERTREVGLMKALGAKKKNVFILFLFEALIISIFGGLLGILGGYLLGEGVNYLINRLALATGNDPVDIFHTPPVFIFGIIIFSLLVGLFTGIYPSRRASKLNPLDALRYE